MTDDEYRALASPEKMRYRLQVLGEVLAVSGAVPLTKSQIEQDVRDGVKGRQGRDIQQTFDWHSQASTVASEAVATKSEYFWDSAISNYRPVAPINPVWVPLDQLSMTGITSPYFPTTGFTTPKSNERPRSFGSGRLPKMTKLK